VLVGRFRGKVPFSDAVGLVVLVGKLLKEQTTTLANMQIANMGYTTSPTLDMVDFFLGTPLKNSAKIEGPFFGFDVFFESNSQGTELEQMIIALWIC